MLQWTQTMIFSIFSDMIGALIVLGVVIVLHELGHFLVAKFFKIKVETFSVGFGPRMTGFRYGETDYRISWFPLGGYVKMAGENPTDNVTGDPREFLSKPKWQRFLVAAAGPAMNVLLAVVLLTGVYMYGSEIPAYWNQSAVVGIVEQGSVAERVGIRPGDRIVALDGKQNPNWQDVENRIITNPATNLAVTLDRNGQSIQTILTPARQNQDGPAGPAEVGDAGICPVIPVVIRRVWRGFPGDKAGLQPGDEITAVKGKELKSACRPIQEVIKSIPETSFPLTIVRHGETMEVPVDTVVDDGQKRIGMDIPYPTILVKHGVAEAFSQSVAMNKEQ